MFIMGNIFTIEYLGIHVNAINGCMKAILWNLFTKLRIKATIILQFKH